MTRVLIVLVSCLFVVCLSITDVSEYELAFIGHSETSKPIGSAWKKRMRGTCSTKRGCIPIGEHPYLYEYPSIHLKSSLIDYWQHIGVEKVLLEFYCKGRRVAYALFDGKNSNSENWFCKERLMTSSFGDLFPDGCFDNFSARGKKMTRFFIEQDGGKCNEQRGWMAVVEGPGRKCGWCKHTKYPVFLYSDHHHKTFWEKGQFKKADCLAVYIKVQRNKITKGKRVYG